MNEFAGRLAMITGGGSGMGRELARQLSAEGCHVATCDLAEPALAETRQLCEQDAPPGTRITVHRCDVADESQVLAFRARVLREHAKDHVHLLFNNEGGCEPEFFAELQAKGPLVSMLVPRRSA